MFERQSMGWKVFEKVVVCGLDRKEKGNMVGMLPEYGKSLSIGRCLEMIAIGVVALPLPAIGAHFLDAILCLPT